MRAYRLEKRGVVISMTATGHYRLSLRCILFDAGFEFNVICPIQSDPIHNFLFLQDRQ